MATVLEACITVEQRSMVHFVGTKDINAKDIHKEIFPVYGGSICRLKRLTGGSRNCHFCGKSFADDEKIETEVRKWLR
jgi:hypothetical protein